MLEIRNVVLPNGLKKTINIQGKLIRSIGDSQLRENRFIDARGLRVVPALNLMHVHFRAPGWEYKEDWKHGVRAAIHGGAATVADMPNAKPALTSVELLYQKIQLIGDPSIRYRLWFGATPKNLDQIPEVCRHPLVCGVKMFMGSSTGDLLVENKEDQQRVFQICAEHDILLAVHAEDEQIIRANRARLQNPSITDHNRIRTPEAAIAATKQALQLQRDTRCRLLVLHASTPDELKLIWEAKQDGRAVYAEVCPHHWRLDEELLQGERGGFFKVNPPLRSPKQASRYLELISAPGVVDIISPDHAPHLAAEKCGPKYDDIPSGMPGVRELFPLAHELARSGLITFGRFIELTSSNAARIFGLPNGHIASGYSADLVLFDPDEAVVFRNEDVWSKCGWTAYDDAEVHGAIKCVIVEGEVKLNKLGY